MCTALQWNGFFGRTLDLEYTLPHTVTATAPDRPLSFRHGPTLDRHLAFTGTALVRAGQPLYFDAVNEAGLAMAGLNFPVSGQYGPPLADRDNIASFQVIPWFLAQCRDLDQVRRLADRLRITDDAFAPDLPPTPLHWMAADRTGALVLEPCADGLHWYEAPTGVLTNEPPYPQQLQRLPVLTTSPFAQSPVGHPVIPGDLSSPSRFVRTVLGRQFAEPDVPDRKGQFFHLLDAVRMVPGWVRLPDGRCQWTQYTSCCDLTTGTYELRR